MRPEEIRALTTEEIKGKLDDHYRELFNLRFQKATGQMKDNSRLRQVKRAIARFKTILRERDLWQQWEDQAS